MNTDDLLTPDELFRENSRRLCLRHERENNYDPVAGKGSYGERIEVPTPVKGLPVARIPRAMRYDPQYKQAAADPVEWQRMRCRYDFEYWCATCVHVRHKINGRYTPFILNAPQRRVTAVLEADRLARVPMRLIMLKARQWGGSTLVQMYMAWIQSCLRRNWNSLICAHVKDVAAGIRGMYTRMLADYPEELWQGDEPPRFVPYERTLNVRELAGRGCRVTIGSAENQEAVRGADYCMAHLSETAFWPSTPRKSADDLIRAVCGAIALIPDSLIVMESTANGVGSYFHREWLRCCEGKGDKRTVFVPWYDIPIYRLDPPDAHAFYLSFTPYERMLWDMGLCLDQIYWYRRKSAEYAMHEQMMAEFPTTDVEAFLNSGNGVFAPEHVERMRESCRPAARRCEPSLPDVFADDSLGRLHVWSDVVPGERYVVAVDIGGRSAGADWSVIAVMRRASHGEERHEVVAQWRGHTDHDLLVDYAEAMARHYNMALLIIESNTLETEAAGSQGLFVLSRLAERYPAIYRRQSFDTATGLPAQRLGFHTNRATKALIIADLIAAVREGLYVERDHEACNELLTYEQLATGAYAARAGCHDDILMTRALALHALHSLPEARPDVHTACLHRTPRPPRPRW